MPKSAIQTGQADCILPVAKIPAALIKPRQKPLVITIAADAKYYIRNEARLISQGLMRRSTMQTINISEVGQHCQVRNVDSKYRNHALLKKNF